VLISSTINAILSNRRLLGTYVHIMVAAVHYNLSFINANLRASLTIICIIFFHLSFIEMYIGKQYNSIQIYSLEKSNKNVPTKKIY